jgi:hypothetical protein
LAFQGQFSDLYLFASLIFMPNYHA